MEHIHIYRPTVFKGRTVRKCTTCRKKRRFLVRFFEWHETEWICGGCGHLWISSNGRMNTGKRAREHNRGMLRDQWPTMISKEDALKRLMIAIKR